MSIAFQQVNRWIDGIDGQAGDFRNDFIEKVRDQFTDEELKTLDIQLEYFNHVPKHIVQALETNKDQTIDGDTVSIEVSIAGQLFALLYERRTETNHAEIAYFINKRFLEYLRKGESLEIENQSGKGIELNYILNPSHNNKEDTKRVFLDKVYSSTFLRTQENNHGFVKERNVYYLKKVNNRYSTQYNRHTIELTISNHLVALLYERRQDNQEELIGLINHTMIKQQNTNELANQYRYDRLRYGFRLIHSVDDEDFAEIKHIINHTDLSDYMIDQKDFLAIKNNNDQIVAFGRLFSIGEGQKEISTLWVDPEERGSKIGLYLCKQLLDEKKGDDEIYLACKPELVGYYNKLGFEVIENDIPKKLVHTLVWASSHGKEFVIMKH